MADKRHLERVFVGDKRLLKAGCLAGGRGGELGEPAGPDDGEVWVGGVERGIIQSRSRAEARELESKHGQGARRQFS